MNQDVLNVLPVAEEGLSDVIHGEILNYNGKPLDDGEQDVSSRENTFVESDESFILDELIRKFEDYGDSQEDNMDHNEEKESEVPAQDADKQESSISESLKRDLPNTADCKQNSSCDEIPIHTSGNNSIQGKGTDGKDNQISNSKDGGVSDAGADPEANIPLNAIGGLVEKGEECTTNVNLIKRGEVSNNDSMEPLDKRDGALSAVSEGSTDKTELPVVHTELSSVSSISGELDNSKKVQTCNSSRTDDQVCKPDENLVQNSTHVGDNINKHSHSSENCTLDTSAGKDAADFDACNKHSENLSSEFTETEGIIGDKNKDKALLSESKENKISDFEKDPAVSSKKHIAVEDNEQSDVDNDISPKNNVSSDCGEQLSQEDKPRPSDAYEKLSSSLQDGGAIPSEGTRSESNECNEKPSNVSRIESIEDTLSAGENGEQRESSNISKDECMPNEENVSNCGSAGIELSDDSGSQGSGNDESSDSKYGEAADNVSGEGLSLQEDNARSPTEDEMTEVNENRNSEGTKISNSDSSSEKSEQMETNDEFTGSSSCSSPNAESMAGIEEGENTSRASSAVIDSDKCVDTGLGIVENSTEENGQHLIDHTFNGADQSTQNPLQGLERLLDSVKTPAESNSQSESVIATSKSHSQSDSVKGSAELHSQSDSFKAPVEPHSQSDSVKVPAELHSQSDGQDAKENLAEFDSSESKASCDPKTLAATDEVHKDSPIVRFKRKPLTREEAYLIKIGQIKECSVRLMVLKPELIRAMTVGRIKLLNNHNRVTDFKTYLRVPHSLRVKIARELNWGGTQKKIAAKYGVSLNTVKRIKDKQEMRERKSLKLATNTQSDMPLNSKRTLTFSTRVKIMGKLERGASIEALSHEYGINKSTLKALQRLKNKKIRERKLSVESSSSQDAPERPAKTKEPTKPKTFTKPKVNLAFLLLLILHNTEMKSLSYKQLKQIITHLFPYYLERLRGKNINCIISNTLTKKLGSAKFFDTNKKNRKARKTSLLLEEEEGWTSHIQESADILRTSAKNIMREPELLESLLLGTMRLETLEFPEDSSLDAQKPKEDSGKASASDSVVKFKLKSKTKTKRDSDSGEASGSVVKSKLKSKKTKTKQESETNARSEDSSTKLLLVENSKDSGKSKTLKGKGLKRKSDTQAGGLQKHFKLKKLKVNVHDNLGARPQIKDTEDRSNNLDNSDKISSHQTLDSVIGQKENLSQVSFPSERSSAQNISTDSELRPPMTQIYRPSQGSASSLLTLTEIKPDPDEIQFIEDMGKQSLPKIVSVEDRAFHIWSEKDDSEGLTSPQRKSPGKKKASDSKEKDSSPKKTFGKSLLLLAGKGKTKTSGADSLPFESSNGNETSMPHRLSSGMADHLPASNVGMIYSQPSHQDVRLTYSQMSHAGATTSKHQDARPVHSQVPGQGALPYFTSPQLGQGPLPSHFATPNIPRQARHGQQLSVTSSHSFMPPSIGNTSLAAVSHSPLTSHIISNSHLPQAPLTQTSSSNEDKDKKSVPKVSDCIETWQKVFPWMYYVEEEKSFFCKVCDWAYTAREDLEVFRLQTPKDVYLVAGQLRYHKETQKHRVTEAKKERIESLYHYLYPILKGHLQEISGIKDLISTVMDLAGGTFPGPQDPSQQVFFLTYMLKHIAECIEENLIASLRQSPFFSIVTVRNKDYAIIRWLNSKGESEEHFFCSKISFPNQGMSCLSYLKKKNVNLKMMISYSELSNSVKPNVENAVMLQVPVRYPPLEVCLNWLERASFMKNLFQQFNVLTRLCKSMYHKFAQFPEAELLKNLEEPFSHNCVLNLKVVNFFFKNVKALRKIAQDIYKTTGNMEAFGFSVLELEDCPALMRCVDLFPQLQTLMSSKVSDQHSLTSAMNNFRYQIWQRIKELDPKSKEHHVISLVDIYVSHVLLTLQSPGNEITDVFSKKIKLLTESDIEKFMPNLMGGYIGRSSQFLDELRSLASKLLNNLEGSLLQLLLHIVSSPELAQQYSNLYNLYQKITVLPFLHAHKEQCMFNVASAEVLLSPKIEKRLLLPVALILLEGPSTEQLKTQVMDSWSQKWKISKLHEHL